MPLQLLQQFDNFELLIWEITEDETFWVQQLALNDTEWAALQQQVPQARLHWLASRHAMQLLCQAPHRAFLKNERGKLIHPKAEQHLSISHSGNQIAVVQSNQPVGVDLQIYSPKLQRIAHKYIAASDLERLQKLSNYEAYLHLHWGTKEALFKAYGLGKVDFIQHLHLELFDLKQQGNFKAWVRKPQFEASYQVFYEKRANYYLCVVTEETEITY